MAKKEMVRIQLSHPRVLHDGTAGTEKLYGKGHHEVSQAVYDHWFTQAMLESGDVTVLGEVKKPKAKKGSEDESTDESDDSSDDSEGSDESDESDEESDDESADKAETPDDKAASSQPRKRKKKKSA